MIVKWRVCFILVSLIHRMQLYEQPDESIPDNRLSNATNLFSVKQKVKCINRFQKDEKQDEDDINNTDALSEFQNSSRQARYAASYRGKLGRINLKIHTSEESIKLTTQKKVKVDITSRLSTEALTFTTLKTSQTQSTETREVTTHKNVTTVSATSVTRRKTRLKGNANARSATTRRKQKFWDQVNLFNDPAVYVERNRKTLKIIKDSTVEKKWKINIARPLNSSQAFFTKYSDLRKKLLENSPKLNINDKINETNIVKLLNVSDNIPRDNDISNKHVELISDAKNNMVNTLISKQNSLLAAEWGDIKRTSKLVGSHSNLNNPETPRSRTKNGQFDTEMGSYHLEEISGAKHPSTSKVTDTKSITERYLKQSNFGMAEEIRDEHIAHKLRFNNIVTKPQHGYAESEIISDILAEVQENVETKKSGGTHDIIKTAGFMSDIGYGEYHINRSEINNRVTVIMPTASHHEQGRNSKNRSAKIRTSRLSEESNDVTIRVGPSLNELASNSKKLAESWIDNARSLLRDSKVERKADKKSSVNTCLFDTVWKTLSDISCEIITQIAKITNSVYKTLEGFANKVRKIYKNILGQGEVVRRAINLRFN